jgi:hypothetical protein
MDEHVFEALTITQRVHWTKRKMKFYKLSMVGHSSSADKVTAYLVIYLDWILRRGFTNYFQCNSVKDWCSPLPKQLGAESKGV